MDILTSKFTCPACEKRRYGFPESRPDLFPEPICYYCVKKFETFMRRQANPHLTRGKGKMFHDGEVRPHPKDENPPTFNQYMVIFRRQKGQCSVCRLKKPQMVAHRTTQNGKIRGLRCMPCHIKGPKPKIRIETPKVPLYWARSEWWIRELMWQNPSVKEEFKQLGLTKE